MTLSALICAAVFFPSVPPQSQTGPTEVRYTVRAHDAMGTDDRIPVHVSMRVVNPAPRTVVEIPVWTPGSYRLREFPDRISNVTAAAPGTDVSNPGAPNPEVERLHRHTWQVTSDADEITIEYDVELHGDDRFMMRGAKRRCITYEGPAIYMFVRGHLDVPCEVTFDVPPDWDIACGLDPVGPRRFRAPDYDMLADCPVKLGLFQRFRFESHDTPIHVIVDGPGDIEFDSETWLANIERITDCQGAMFGGLPLDHYTFLYTASPGGGGGGLEHLTSTTIGVRASALRRSPRTGLSTTAHEFFHLWNVKRIRPRELGPFDYTRPNRTTALWIMEGITSYYTPVTLARCGLTDPEEFWTSMRRQIHRLENTAARDHVSSADASRTAWEPSTPDRRLNYYNSGLVLGLLLDVQIRALSDNARSLDDVMRAAFAFCTAEGRGFDPHEFRDLVADAAGSRALDEFFDRHVTGTQVPPYARILARAGVRYTEERSRKKRLRGASADPRGGVRFLDPTAVAPREIVTRQGRVLEVAGEAIESIEDVEAGIADLPDGTTVRVRVENLRGERTLRAEVVSTPEVTVHLETDEAADHAAEAIRVGITAPPR